MRRFVIPLAVLALVSVVFTSQASAFGWRGASWRKATATHYASSTQSPTLAARGTAVPAAPVAEMTEAAALSELIGVMKGILVTEYDRLEQKRQWDEDEPVRSYGLD